MSEDEVLNEADDTCGPGFDASDASDLDESIRDADSDEDTTSCCRDSYASLPASTLPALGNLPSSLGTSMKRKGGGGPEPRLAGGRMRPAGGGAGSGASWSGGELGGSWLDVAPAGGLEDVRAQPAWAARARRLEAKWRDVDGRLVAFSLTHDVRQGGPPEGGGGGGGAVGALAAAGEEARSMRFRLCGASSRCVRNAWRRAGFKKTTKADWTLMWGKPLKPPEHALLHPLQRVCHFPGTYQLGRKDQLARNVARFRRRNGRASFDYLPRTFILPKVAPEPLHWNPC